MSFAETWDSVSDDEANESAFKDREVDQIPDGIYQLKIVRFDYFTTEKGEFHKWGFEVAGGIMAGKYVEKFGTEHPVSIKILKQGLRMVTGRIPKAGEVFDGHETGPIKGELLGKVIDAKKVEVVDARHRTQRATQDRIAARRTRVRALLSVWRGRSSLARRVGVSVETIRRDLNSMWPDLERDRKWPEHYRLRVRSWAHEADARVRAMSGR